MAKYRLALLCAEENPEGCHRRLLTARVLCAHGLTVDHIRGDGRLERERKFSPVGGERTPVQGTLVDVPEERSWRSIVEIYTKKSAAEFFESLKRAGIRRLIDIRLKNSA